MGLMPEKCGESQVKENNSDGYEVRVSRCGRGGVDVHGFDGCDVEGVNRRGASAHCADGVNGGIAGDRTDRGGVCGHGAGGVGVNRYGACARGANRVDGG